MTRLTTISAALAMLAGLLWWGTAAAQQEWPRKAFGYRACKGDLYWGRYCCGGRYRPEGCARWRRQRARAYAGVTRRDPGATCHPVLAATGEQAQSTESAEVLALRAWQGRVRFHHGERYINLATAKDVRLACSPSSVADTVTGKIGEKLLGISHFRCEISARPCRAEARPFKAED